MPTIEPLEKSEHQDRSRTVLYDALDDLCECSEQLEFRLCAVVVKPEITLLDDASKGTIVERRIFPRKHLERCEVLALSSVVPLSHFCRVPDSPEDELDTKDTARYCANVEFCKSVSDLLVMANVGRVGSIELLHSVVVQDDQPLDFSHIPNMDGYSLQRAAEAAERMGWPQLAALDTKTVWNWAVKHHGMLDGFHGSAMGRALNAFSRLFDRKDAYEPMQMLWALVGLEALYTTGKGDLLGQVREKSQVLLGQQESHKKKISRMYDFRSRFVHGALDFPPLCMVGDARQEVARFDDDLLDAIAVAVAVLAGTIQQVIRNDWSGLRFEYTVDDFDACASAGGTGT